MWFIAAREPPRELPPRAEGKGAHGEGGAGRPKPPPSPTHTGAPSQSPRREREWRCLRRASRGYPLMILPQVHLRKPCYDFYFL